MRWRHVDRIDSFEPWKSIRGTKVVSFEDASLHKHFGRRGQLPESLIIEGCVELTRWLVAASSDFKLVAAVSGIEALRFDSPAGLGAVMRMEVLVEDRAEKTLGVTCRVSEGEREIARGRIEAELSQLVGAFDPEVVIGTWRELHGQA
ncbi:MAG: hotdog family protein [Planctomycetota bacterium]|jgi:3-hydroxymyristoyl/3-hydroxydecanoyl-(acyl carrier protein) dehydratase